MNVAAASNATRPGTVHPSDRSTGTAPGAPVLRQPADPRQRSVYGAITRAGWGLVRLSIGSLGGSALLGCAREISSRVPGGVGQHLQCSSVGTHGWTGLGIMVGGTALLVVTDKMTKPGIVRNIVSAVSMGLLATGFIHMFYPFFFNTEIVDGIPCKVDDTLQLQDGTLTCTLDDNVTQNDTVYPECAVITARDGQILSVEPRECNTDSTDWSGYGS